MGCQSMAGHLSHTCTLSFNTPYGMFGRCEETGEPEGNPCRRRENISYNSITFIAEQLTVPLSIFKIVRVELNCV